MPRRLLISLLLAALCSCSSDGGGPAASAGAAAVAGAPSGGAASGNAGAAQAGAGGTVSASGASGAGSAGTPSAGAGGAGGAGGATGPVSDVTVVSRFPATGATACADAALRLGFSHPVTVGSAGTIRLFRVGPSATLVDSIDVAAAGPRDTIAGRMFFKVRPIFIEGSDALIYFKTQSLAAGSYFVTMDAGVFVDAQQRALPAITDAKDWAFSTKEPTPADPTKLSVARDGSADFCSVQGAVDFVPAANLTPTTIEIANATYHEIVFISAKHNLTFHGKDRKQTIIAYPNNDALQMKLGTGYRAMVEAEGSNGLVFDNLTLHNTTPQGGSQAEALRSEPGDKVILRNSDFVSLQDTLLLSGRVYVTNSYVEGNVDFIWGKGTVYFDTSEIKTVGRAGYLVQSRNGSNYGYVFVDSTFTTDGSAPGATMLARIEGDRFPDSNVAFVNCKLGPQIAPKGWLITNSTGMPVSSLDLSKLKFWEYKSTNLAGVALDVSLRDPASKQVTDAVAAMLRDKATVLAGWNPTP